MTKTFRRINAEKDFKERLGDNVAMNFRSELKSAERENSICEKKTVPGAGCVFLFCHSVLSTLTKGLGRVGRHFTYFQYIHFLIVNFL